MSAYVLFFGGFQATRQHVNAWAASAKSQRSDVTFDAFPWPASARKSDDVSATTAFKEAGTFDLALGTIRECSGGGVVYLVGHSSGCAIANAVDKAVDKAPKEAGKVVLVALDGFLPGTDQLARPSTQVWSAVCGTAVAVNHDKLKKWIGGRLKTHKATRTYDPWALHFSLVNSAATDRDNGTIATGYNNCRANLMWLPPAAP